RDDERSRLPTDTPRTCVLLCVASAYFWKAKRSLNFSCRHQRARHRLGGPRAGAMTAGGIMVSVRASRSSEQTWGEEAGEAAALGFVFERWVGVVGFGRRGGAGDEQAQGGGVSGTRGRSGHAVEGLRARDAHLLVQDARGDVADAGELRAAAGQHGAAANGNVEAAFAETKLSFLEDLFEPRLDDGGQPGAAHAIDAVLVGFAHLRDFDGVGGGVGGRERGAVERLDAFRGA